ncbi:MAG: ABC transporter substrate-binding protein [Clostridia bacterium]|nr:ABC transporter substrate-binding protein [Clostridia bacterium]
MKLSARIIALILSVVLLLPLTACGNKNYTVYEVGICQLVEHSAHDEATKGFIDALNYQFGEGNIRFDVQSAQNDLNLCSSIMNQFVSNDVDLILANATAALQTAASSTNQIPILGTSVTEYGVALDIDGFDGTVGGNISGTSDLAPLDEQAKMIKEWVPDAKTCGLLYCSAEANSLYQIDVVKKELEALGITPKLYPFSDSTEISSVCTIAAEETDVLYVPTDNTVASNAGIIDNICRPLKRVVIGGEEDISCAVAALSISYYDLGYTTGLMAGKILRGEAEISEMPIEYTTAEKKYNKELCDYLGLTAPEGYTPIANEEN